MNFLIKKNPGDGTIHALKEALGKTGGALLALEVLGDDINPDFISNFEQTVATRPHEPINLVFDLTHANNPERWAATVTDVMLSGRLGSASLPEKSAIVTVAREVESLPTFLLTKAVHIPRDNIRILTDVIDHFRNDEPEQESKPYRQEGQDLEI